MSLLLGSLLAEFRSYVSAAHSDVVIIAPFINSQALERVLQGIDDGPAVSVVTTWCTDDILRRASDINVYPLLRERGAHLYLHRTLHAKLLIADWTSVLVTSANITLPGLGVAVPPNIECAATPMPLSPAEELWVRRLIADSLLVQDDSFAHFQEQLLTITKQELPRLPQLDLLSFERRKDFLLSSLPMSDSPDRLLELLDELARGTETTGDVEEVHAALHDAALYQLPLEPVRADTRSMLARRFLGHPFIAAFLAFVSKLTYFGTAKAWLQNHCANVPVPRRRTLTGHTRVLFDWVVALSDGVYLIDRPRHSECLVRVSGNMSPEVE